MTANPVGSGLFHWTEAQAGLALLRLTKRTERRVQLLRLVRYHLCAAMAQSTSAAFHERANALLLTVAQELNELAGQKAA